MNFMNRAWLYIIRKKGKSILLFIILLVMAFLISPYGLPMAASWLTERVADFNRMLKSI